MSFYEERQVKQSRKSRTCDWCYEQIEKGDPYVAAAGIWDGDFFRASYHPECSRATHLFGKLNPHDDLLPDCAMNRGGVQEAGDIEVHEPLIPT